MFFTSAQTASVADVNNSNIWGSTSETWTHNTVDETFASSGWGSSAAVSDECPVDVPICKFFVSGNCSAGEWCRFSHTIPSNMISEAYICEICSEDVFQRGSKFGLLENCDHVFCLACIREWRNQKEKQDRLNLRKCPICRVDSFVIIPALHYMTGQAKASEKSKYCQHLSMIPCKNFDNGKGSCPFGTSCLYFHAGTTAVDSFVLLKGADGTRTKKHSQLSDFLRY